ncbi:MAG: anhydro-N-acetylmuramic acid kinase [Candidatus Eisenbacteria bacterium]|nr:anhydro-N-acetylmuramic acid kinase [Candidatus Eisenbacteria bacterium]
MNELTRIARKRTRRVIGLMAGTSLDGISAAVVDVTGSGPDTKAVLLEHATFAFDPEVKAAILKASSPETGTVDLLSELNFVIGELLAEAARKIVEQSGLSMADVDLIGSHGQTVYHCPRGGRTGWGAASTLQIGEPCVLAERTGVTTVADFRTRDVAAGGCGAPLVPYVDFVLLRSEEKSRVVLNIGGIANITVLPKGCAIDDVFAFDTGPGNIAIDGVVRVLTGGKQEFDSEGKLAAEGSVNLGIVEAVLGHEYFGTEPPKSTGREMFGSEFAGLILEKARALGLSQNDIAATTTAITARSIHDACVRFVYPKVKVDEVVASGGGTRNDTLARMLKDTFTPVPVVMSDECGVNSMAKEAIAFAVLANEAISGGRANVPGATGARRRVILGKIVPAAKGD